MLKSTVKIFPLALGTVSLLSLLLLLFPWSLSTQTSSFSLSLDLDNSEGDQAVSSLDVFPNRTVPIQIFGTDIASASDLSLRFEFDPTQIAYEGFKRANIVSGTSALPGMDFANIGITLSAGNAYSGLYRHDSLSHLRNIFRHRHTIGACKTGARWTDRDRINGPEPYLAACQTAISRL